jgi:hypothetical protein
VDIILTAKEQIAKIKSFFNACSGVVSKDILNLNDGCILQNIKLPYNVCAEKLRSLHGLNYGAFGIKAKID